MFDQSEDKRPSPGENSQKRGRLTAIGETVTSSPWVSDRQSPNAVPNDSSDRTRRAPLKVVGDFVLIREIGRGGMGIVYEARQQSLDKRVALKVLPHATVFDPRAVRRFQNEAWAAARLQHRNIVPVYQVGHENDVHFYAMQYIDGGDLADLVACLRNPDIRREEGLRSRLRSESAYTDPVAEQDQTAPVTLSPESEEPSDRRGVISDKPAESTRRSGWSKGDTLASPKILELVEKSGTTSIDKYLMALVNMGIQVSDALHYAHEMGVVHRDIKPSNLLLDTEGEVWVADFGLAQIQNNVGMTATGAMVGTLRYMSPEQAMGKRLGIDHRSDVYSLGATLYELLTLRPAIVGESRDIILQRILFQDPVPPRKIDRRIPVDLETIIVKAMAKNPGDRYQSAGELANDLRRFREGEPILGRKPNLLQRMTRWGMRNRRAVASMAAVMLLTFVGSIVMAGLGWNLFASTVVALNTEKEERAEVERLLRRSEGLRLASSSALQLGENPSMALLLAIEGVKRFRSPATHNALLETLDAQHELHSLSGHSGPVGHVTFNSQGNRLISCSAQSQYGKGPHPAIVWDVATGKKIGTLQDDETVTSSAFSPDRFRIVTASSPGEAKRTEDPDQSSLGLPPTLWDALQFQNLFRFEDAYLFEAHDAIFGPEGRRAVFPSSNNTATIYDCVGGHKLVELTGHDKRVVFAAMSPQGDRVVTASDDNTVRVWDAGNGELIHTFDLWKNRDPSSKRCVIDSIEFRGDGRQLVTASIKYGTQLWDMVSGERVNTEYLKGGFATYGPHGLQLLTHYPLGREIIVNSVVEGRTLRQWRVPTGGVRNIKISPNGRWIAMLGGRDASEMSIRDARTGEPYAQLIGHERVIVDYAFSPDSNMLATASADRTVKLWHLDNGRERSTYHGDSWAVAPRAIPSPDGKQLATVGGEPVTAGLLLDFPGSEPMAEIPARIWLPDFTSTRVVGTRGFRLSLHSLDDGSELGSVTSPNNIFDKAAINLDGDRVAAFGGGDSVLLWFPDEGKRMLLPCGPARINHLEFNHRGDRLASAGADGYVRLWDADSMELINSLQNDGKVVTVVFSPDDRRVAAVTDQGRVVLWDVESLEKVTTMQAPGTVFHDLRFSFDGKHAITFRKGGSTEVQLWDVATGDLKSRLPATGEVDVAMHPGRAEALITSTGDGAVVWRYDQNVRQPVVATPMRFGKYSFDGGQLLLGVCSPMRIHTAMPSTAPEDVYISAVQQWDRNRLVLLNEIEIGAGVFSELKMTRDDRVVVNSDRIHNADLFDVATHRRTSRIAGHAAPISDAIYTSDSARFVTASWDRTVSVWDANDGTLVKKLQGHQAAVQCLALKDDSTLISGDNNGRIIVWDVESGQRELQFDITDAAIIHAAFAPVGNQVLLLSADHTLHVFDLDAEREIDLDFGIDRVFWAEYSKTGDSLLVIPLDHGEDNPQTPIATRVSGDKNLLLVPLDGSTVTAVEHDGPLITATLNPAGDQILSLTEEGTITLRDLKTTQVLKRFSHSSGRIASVALDPTGRWLAVVGNTETTLWKIEDEAKWYTVPTRLRFGERMHHDTPFIPNTSRLVTPRVDSREFRDWPLDPLEEAMRRAPRALSDAERNRFYVENPVEAATNAASNPD